MRIKKPEELHIKALGENWPRALAIASLSIRQNSKLVGLDKIRDPMAVCAALKATGCPDHEGFVIPKSAGDPHIGQEIVDGAYADAVKAITDKLGEPVR